MQSEQEKKSGTSSLNELVRRAKQLRADTKGGSLEAKELLMKFLHDNQTEELKLALVREGFTDRIINPIWPGTMQPSPMRHTEDLKKSGVSFPAWISHVDSDKPEVVAQEDPIGQMIKTSCSTIYCGDLIVDLVESDESSHSCGYTSYLRRAGEYLNYEKVNSEEEAYISHVKSGKPVSLVRDWRPYRFGQYGVWKICSYIESEATAIGFNDGAGPMKDHCTSIKCVWTNGNEFNVSRFANNDIKKDIWQNRHLIQGKKIRFIYQEESSIMKIPVGAMFIEVKE